MQKEIVLAIAISLSLMAIGITAGTTTPEFTYTSYTDRPNNFALTDYAAVSGFNSFQSSTLADAGGVDEMTKVSALPCVSGSAPEEKSYQSAYMEFYKNGQTVDPAVSETVTSDITVGAVSTATTNTINSDGTLNGKVGEGYDLFTSTVGGIAGTPVVDSNKHLTGITDNPSREVFSNVQSFQDDYITATGADSAGTGDKTLTSYTTATVGSSTMPENTPYVQFDWQDVRGYDTAGTDTGMWTIQNIEFYQQILPSDYRSGKYL